MIEWILVYVIAALLVGSALGRHLRRQRECALFGRLVIEPVRDERLDIEPALRREVR